MKSLEFKNQIVGLIRFSFPAKNAFRHKYETDQDQLNALFSPDRMAFRFEMLEKLCFHSMARQTDQNFRLIFLVGSEMPVEYLERLEDIIGNMPGAVIFPHKKEYVYRATRKAFLSVIDQKNDYITAFRLDDDDAVAMDYIAKTRAKMNALIKAEIVSQPTALAYTTGIYWQVNENKANAFNKHSERTPLGLACAMITTSDMPTNLYRYNHRQLGSLVPTILDPSDVMYVRTIHAYNDSGNKHYRESVQSDDLDMANILKLRFGLDINEITEKNP